MVLVEEPHSRSMSTHPLSYERSSERRFRNRSGAEAFVAEIVVDGEGLVLYYERFWQGIVETIHCGHFCRNQRAVWLRLLVGDSPNWARLTRNSCTIVFLNCKLFMMRFSRRQQGSSARIERRLPYVRKDLGGSAWDDREASVRRFGDRISLDDSRNS